MPRADDGRSAVLALVLALTLALCVGLPGVGSMILTNSFITAVFIVTIVLVSRCNNKCCCVCCRDVDAGQQQPSTTQTALVVAAESGATTGAVAARPPRAVYLDNLKVVLTAIVVNHHSMLALGAQGGWFFGIAGNKTSFSTLAGWISTLDQCYFMCLFFFISGLFTPASYDKHMRKGTGACGFLRDKCLRLGVPFICFAFIFGPLLDCFVQGALIPRLGSDPAAEGHCSYNVNPGPPWFLSWLLLLNFCYAFRGGARSEAPVAIPSLGATICCCAVLGALDFTLAAALKGNSFAMMPVIGLGDLPFDLVFFSAGCCASSKRSAWLEPAVEWWDAVEMPAFAGVCVAALLVLIPQVMDLAHMDRSAPPGQSGSLSDASTPTYLATFAFMGVCTALISVWLLAMSRKRFNYTTPRLTMMANAAYTVYLIHPWVIVPVTGVYVTYLHEVGGVDFLFANGSAVSFEASGPPGMDTQQWEEYVWGGWVFVALSSQLLVWPLAHFFRKLPLVRQVL